jgi:hypothetical protein
VKYAAFGQLENRICLHQAASQGNLNFSNNENQSSERARLFLTTAEIAERASRPFSIELANPKTLAARGTAALDPYISRHFYQKMPCSFFVDVDPCVVVLMKSRLRVNLTSVRATVPGTGSCLQRPDVQLEDRCSSKGSP